MIVGWLCTVWLELHGFMSLIVKHLRRRCVCWLVVNNCDMVCDMFERSSCGCVCQCDTIAAVQLWRGCMLEGRPSTPTLVCSHALWRDVRASLCVVCVTQHVSCEDSGACAEHVLW